MKPSKPSRRSIRFVRKVTREQGMLYADEWFTHSLCDAIEFAGIMRWPSERSEQLRFHDLEDEINKGVYALVREAIEEAFVKVASEVIARERAKARDVRK